MSLARRAIVRSLDTSARVRFRAENAIEVVLGERSLLIRDLDAGVQNAFSLLAKGCTEADIEQASRTGNATLALAEWYYVERLLAGIGALRYSVQRGDETLATAVPYSRWFDSAFREPRPAKRLIVSRFAHVRRHRHTLVLESPLSLARIELVGTEALRLLSVVRRPSTVSEICSALPDVNPSAITSLLSLLGSMIAEEGEDGRFEEEERPPIAHWEFADAVLHAYSRRVGCAERRGGTYRFGDRFGPLPAAKAPMSEDVIPLYRPDLDVLRSGGPSFTTVLEDRRSIRGYGERPMTIKQLGEFLYRTARVKSIVEPDGNATPYETSLRPYPSAGASYELELYPMLVECDGAPSGFYHYDPMGHRLERLPHRASFETAVLDGVQRATGGGVVPQVVIIISSRFRRVAWKYEGIAYVSVLKDVGVLYQTMYLVATDMGLAPCALGAGDGEESARAIGTTFWEECSVGEFLLGSREP